MKNAHLGKDIEIPLQYNPKILTPLNRLESRIKAGFKDLGYNFYGYDYWTSYETSWLDNNGKPNNRILNISYKCNSKYFIESKSLKLYLYSLNNKKFDSSNDVTELIKKDLEDVLETDIDIELSKSPRIIENSYNSIDKIEIDKLDTHPNALIIEPGEEIDVEESISSSLFRSLCPVTSQPDWATIYISYKGNSIKHESLLRYLLSYRNHQGFHEECVERIFVDILKRCRLDDLTVKANFLRRGGIEINPVRMTSQGPAKISREIRQ